MNFKRHLQHLQESVKQKIQSKYPLPSKENNPNSVVSKIEETPNEVYLGMVLVPYKNRNKKIGTKFMKDLIKIAKQENKDIRLNVSDMYSDDNDMKEKDLIKWYKSFGFEMIDNYKKEMILKLRKQNDI